MTRSKSKEQKANKQILQPIWSIRSLLFSLISNNLKGMYYSQYICAWVQPKRIERYHLSNDKSWYQKCCLTQWRRKVTAECFRPGKAWFASFYDLQNEALRMYECTYVCMCVRTHVCMYVRVYVCTYVRVYVCVYEWTNVPFEKKFEQNSCTERS